MRTQSRATEQFRFTNLNGGLATRPAPLVIEANSKKKMQSPALRNVDFFQTGAISKRLGKTMQGAGIAAVWAEQTSSSGATVSPGEATGLRAAVCQQFVAPSTQSVVQATVKLAASTLSSVNPIRMTAILFTDSAGSPGAQVGSPSSNGYISNLTTPENFTFIFPVPVSLTSGTTYWLVLQAASSQTGNRFLTRGNGAGSSGRVKTTLDAYSTFTTSTVNDLYYQLFAYVATTVTQGLYDYRTGISAGATSPITQSVMAAVGGALYYHARDATPLTGAWTSLTTGLGNASNQQDALFAFAVLDAYLFTTDYAYNPPRAWDASSTATMKAGYRLTPWYVANYTELSITSTAGSTLTMDASMAANGLYVGKTIYLTGSATLSPQVFTIASFVTTGTAGTSNYYVTSIVLTDKPYTDHTKVRFNGATIVNNNAAGSISTTGALTCFSILAVTSLKSGGFRASEFSVDTEAGNTSQIEFTNIAMANSTDGTGFGFDIADKATTWFMSAAFDPGANQGAQPTITYYKILVGNISTGTNPNTNATTAFNITAITNLTTGASLLDTYALEASYFTGQVDMPKAKFFATFQNMLFSAGDPSNPTRLWISEQDAPNVWGAEGGLLGNFLDIAIGGDNDTITGLFAFNEYLYVFKRHTVYIIAFTGNSQVPFQVQRIAADIGCLSHWSVKAISNSRFTFLSERGPATCYGTQIAITPSAANILDRFDPNNTSRYNLSAMQYATAGVNATKNQVWWGVSSTSATTRDLTLVYDYENDAFYEHDISANYYAEVTDGNFFPSIWSGDYSAQVFQHESGLTDNGSTIAFNFESPNIQFGDPFSWKHIDQLFVAGTVQASGTLYVDLYTDFSTTAAKTVSFSMSAAKFKTGSYVPVGLRCKALRVNIRNSEISVPVQIDAFGFGYQDRGTSV